MDHLKADLFPSPALNTDVGGALVGEEGGRREGTTHRREGEGGLEDYWRGGGRGKTFVEGEGELVEGGGER